MKLKNFLNESNTSSATNMESVIVALVNNEKVPYPELEKDGRLAVDFLTNKGITGKATHLGSGASSITSDWKNWGGTDNTPKSDFKIGKYRVSLKKTGGSQLMSAKKGEARATCYAGFKTAHIDSGPVVDMIEKYLDKMIEGKSAENISQQKKSGTVTQDILDADKMHKLFQTELRKELSDNTVLKQAIVHEAMTGDQKFGGGSDARAEFIFVYDPSGKNMSWNHTDDPAFIAKKTGKARIAIGWKSVSSTTKKSGKVYSYFSSFRLTEEINNHINQEFAKYNGRLITEGILSTITDRIKNWFNNVWKRIKEWLLQSFDNILIFFDLVPDVEMSEVVF
jgi:hypothetical protein